MASFAECAIKKADRYSQIFGKFDVEETGFLGAVTVHSILTQSGLDEGILGDIWSISNVEDADSLSLDQFTTAMHLTELVKEEGFDLQSLRKERDTLPAVPERTFDASDHEDDVEYEILDRTPSGRRSQTTLHETSSSNDVVLSSSLADVNEDVQESRWVIVFKCAYWVCRWVGMCIRAPLLSGSRSEVGGAVHAGVRKRSRYFAS